MEWTEEGAGAKFGWCRSVPAVFAVVVAAVVDVNQVHGLLSCRAQLGFFLPFDEFGCRVRGALYHQYSYSESIRLGKLESKRCFFPS